MSPALEILDLTYLTNSHKCSFLMVPKLLGFLKCAFSIDPNYDAINNCLSLIDAESK